MHPINKIFDKIICINLAERPEKREKSQQNFNILGLDVEFFTAVKYDFIPNIVPAINQSGTGKFNPKQPYELGAALSHYHVIKQALAEGAERIFVMEDDVMFHKNFNKKWDLYYRNLPKNWDMFLLYSFMYEWLPQNKRMNAYWAKSYRSWSLMTYGMNRRLMEAYIEMQDKHFTISDMVTYKLQENPLYNCYSAVPSLCIPSTASSDIRGIKNYEQNQTVTNWGVSNDEYELSY